VVDEHRAQQAKQLKAMRDEIDVCLAILRGQWGGIWGGGGGGSGASKSFPKSPSEMGDSEVSHTLSLSRTYTEVATQASVRLFALMSHGVCV
jgi:hypothetical protein